MYNNTKWLIIECTTKVQSNMTSVIQDLNIKPVFEELAETELVFLWKHLFLFISSNICNIFMLIPSYEANLLCAADSAS